jgi:hypothetical protein
MPMEQRWLSKRGICDVLGISKWQLRSLVRQKYLVKIGKPPNDRYLDPTPEYIEQFKVAKALHAKHYELKRDINFAALFTVQELAAILNISVFAARGRAKKFPRIKGKGHSDLLTVNDVRNLVWRVSDRKQMSKQRSPFLLTELIAWFWKHYKAEFADVPTDAAFAEDALLQKKIRIMMNYPSPQKELALKSFLDTVEIAKQVVSIVKTDDS